MYPPPLAQNYGVPINLFPITRTPYPKDIPLSQVLVSIDNSKIPPFSGFLEKNLHQTMPPKYPFFPEKIGEGTDIETCSYMFETLTVETR